MDEIADQILLENPLEKVLPAEMPQAPQPKSVKMQVGILGEQVFINYSQPVDLVAYTPAQALTLANELRGKANQVLSAQHKAEARIRREKREKRR